MFQQNKLKIKNINEEEFFIKILTEFSDLIYSEFNQNFNEKKENLEESFYGIYHWEKVLLNFLNNQKFEKSYSLISETILLSKQIVISLEKKDFLEKINYILALIIKNLLMIAMKWEDYLVNPWNPILVCFI